MASHQALSSPPGLVADAVCNVLEEAGGPKELRAAVAPRGDTHNAPPPPMDAFHQAVAVTAAQDPEQVVAPLLEHRTVPYNDLTDSGIIEFETPLFAGQALLLLRNLPNSPSSVFHGKRRQMVLAVQGRFKRADLPLDGLVLGSVFQRALRLPLSPLITQAAVWLARKMGGGVQLQPHGSHPHVFAPLVAAAQVINVAPPGQQPDLRHPHEDMRLFGPGLAHSWTGKPLSSKQRRSHFSHAAHRRGFYDTQHVWTFQLYDHVCDYATMMLNVPLLKFDLVQVLDGQPMQLMLRDAGSGLSMLHLTVWHKRMLAHAANAEVATSAVAAAAAGAARRTSSAAM